MRSRMIRAAALCSLLLLLCGQALQAAEMSTSHAPTPASPFTLGAAEAVGAGWLQKHRALVIEAAGCFGLGVTVGAAIGGIVPPVGGVIAAVAAIRCFI